MAAPRRRLTTSAASARPGAGVHAWDRLVVGWHVAFWVMLAITFVAIGLSHDLTGGRRAVAATSFAVLGVAYAGLVMRSGRGRHPGLYLAVAVVVTGIACGLDPSLSLVLFVVYPQTWLLSPSSARAIVATGAVTLAAASGLMTYVGWSVETLIDVGPQMLVGMLFSLLLGLWISRVVEQSAQRAQLIDELEAARTELAAAHHAQGVLTERERMAREIHDTLAQGFVSVITLAQAASADLAAAGGTERGVERLRAMEDVARDNLAEARALVAALAPADLDGGSLRDALGRLVDRFRAETGLAIDLDADDVAGLPRDCEVVLLRATQEALSNVRRHAQASRVGVRLCVDASGARVEVTDDGAGFAPGSVEGFGIAGLRGRVEGAGGRVDIASAPGDGTRVVFHVPVEGPR